VRRCGLLIGVLLLGVLGASKATPLDSADIVYIDGLPCNRFCQFYLARSSAASMQKLADDQATKIREWGRKRAGRDRLARVAAARNEMPPTRMAALPRVGVAADPETRRGGIADMRAEARFTDDSRTTTIRDQLATAAAVAEQLADAGTAAFELKVMNSDHASIASWPDSGKRDPATANQTDAEVALVVSRPEIKTLAYLTRANVAIDGEHSATASGVRTALLAGGAVDVQVVRAGERKAIDRLMSGEVPAAVLTLVSADAARAFPDIDGFKIYRIPLPPRS
jgi:hypothetical protein